MIESEDNPGGNNPSGINTTRRKTKDKPMLRVYIASPLRATSEHSFAENIKLAKALCHAAVIANTAPYAPHLFFTQFLDDSIAEERALGMKAGLAWMSQADEIWAYAESFDQCSSGMKAEIEAAQKLSIPPEVRYMPKAWDAVAPRKKIYSAPAVTSKPRERNEYGLLGDLETE